MEMALINSIIQNSVYSIIAAYFVYMFVVNLQIRKDIEELKNMIKENDEQLNYIYKLISKNDTAINSLNVKVNGIEKACTIRHKNGKS